MVVITPSYNNATYYERNLDSIFSQDYENFHLIYYDDASTDNTYQLVSEYIHTYGHEEKTTLLRNPVNMKANFNFYKAIHDHCEPSDIVVIVDGDDWLTNSQVLAKLNQYYANPDVWVTYGNYQTYPKKKGSCCKPVTKKFLKSGNIRRMPWYFTHLRTFYAGLFQQIRLEDFVDRIFFDVTYDFAIMFPIIEMATDHTFFVPKPLYTLNRETELSDEVVRPKEQIDRANYILKQRPYSKLNQLPKYFSSHYPIDAILICEDINALESSITCLNKQLYGLNHIYVIGKETLQTFAPIADNVTYLRFDFPKEELPENSIFYLCSTNSPKIDREINLISSGYRLLQTGAQGYFFFNKGEPNTHVTNIWDDCAAWDFRYAKGDFAKPHQTKGVLYPFRTIQSLLSLFDQCSFDEALETWSHDPTSSHVGICPPL